jgi:hypothetical protein
MGRPTPTGAVRERLLAAYDSLIARFAADLPETTDPDLAGDMRFDAAQSAVAGVKPLDTYGLIESFTTGQEPKQPPPQRDLRRATAALLQASASGGEDLAYGDIFDAAQLLGLLPSEADVHVMASGERADEHELARSLQAWSFAKMRRQLGTFPEDDMRRGLRAVATASMLLKMMFFFALPAVAGVEQIFPPELAHLERAAMPALQAVREDPMWRMWGQFLAALDLRPRKHVSQLALAAASALLTDTVPDIEAYAQRLHDLLYASPSAI